MRFQGLIAICALFLISIVHCFTGTEVEIFQLQQELAKKYGADINLYQFLKLPKLEGSTGSEITKNLRKLSKKYHPDKNSKYRKLYERLNIATNILADEETRKVYDYYLKNGFPDYDFQKGGFYFKRVRPAVWFTMLFLFFTSGVAHLILLKIQNNSNKSRINNFVKRVRDQDTTQGLGECNLLFKESENSDEKKLLVKFGDVYILNENGSSTKISAENVVDPTIKDTLIVKFPKLVIKMIMKVLGRDESKTGKDIKGSNRVTTVKMNAKNSRLNKTSSR